MTQANPAVEEDEEKILEIQQRGVPFEQVKLKRSSLQGKDVDITDWLCEIGIKYDFDY